MCLIVRASAVEEASAVKTIVECLWRARLSHCSKRETSWHHVSGITRFTPSTSRPARPELSDTYRLTQVPCGAGPSPRRGVIMRYRIGC